MVGEIWRERELEDGATWIFSTLLFLFHSIHSMKLRPDHDIMVISSSCLRDIDVIIVG